MISPYYQSQFVEKILTDSRGREFRVLFLVALVGGQMVARPVSVQPVLTETLAISGDVCQSNCLPCFNTKSAVCTEYISSFAPVASPYTSLDFILTSQPTRAPSNK